MKQFDDNEYFLFKALSESVISSVSPALERVKKHCETAIVEINAIEKKLEDSLSGAEINKYSKLSEEKRTELVRLLAIKNRIEQLIIRNQSRIKYIKNVLKNSGIYNETFDKKLISEIEKQETENISIETLGLNLFEGEDEFEEKFFNGEILKLKNGELDFSIEDNAQILKKANDDFVSEIVKVYPSSFSTVPASVLVETNVKKRILKTIATYVIDETKKRDIKDVNKSLGNLLEFTTQITASPEDFIAGVSNMFNVQVRQFLIEQNPQSGSDIKGKLKCNEKSELIPESKRVAVLSAGIAGEISSENEESEEMRIAREKEEREKNEAVKLIEEISNELEIQKEIAEDQDEKADIEDMKKQQEELHKITKEERKEKKLEEMSEEQLIKVMTNNRFDDD